MEQLIMEQPIKKTFESYVSSVYEVEKLSDIQYREIKQAFFAGALNIFVDMCEQSTETETGVSFFNAISAELDDFVVTMKKEGKHER